MGEKKVESEEAAAETAAQAAPASALQFARDPDHETPEVQPPLVDQAAPTYTLRADDQDHRSALFTLLRLVGERGPSDRVREIERIAREFELYEAAQRETPKVRQVMGQGVPSYTLRADDQDHRSALFAVLHHLQRPYHSHSSGMSEAIQSVWPGQGITRPERQRAVRPDLERAAREFELYEAAHRE